MAEFAVPAPSTRLSRRAPVPAALFSAERPPAFVLFTPDGARVQLTPGLRSQPEDVVYVSRFDFAALIHYLREHLAAIAKDDGLALEVRAWATHRVLVAEAVLVARGGGTLPGRELIAAARALAQLVARDARAFPALNALLGGPYTPAGHAAATAIVATALAAADGVREPERLTGIALGGLFADSGKLDVAGSAISRPGPLTDAEWDLMLRHPRRSVELLRDAGVLFAQAQHGVLHHHERWDGEGYPERRRGPEIPIEARYIAIADSYCAMTVDRPYRPSRNTFEAVTEMVSDGGFEPRLLRLFVPLLAA